MSKDIILRAVKHKTFETTAEQTLIVFAISVEPPPLVDGGEGLESK